MMTLAILFAAGSPAVVLSSAPQARYETQAGNEFFRTQRHLYDESGKWPRLSSVDEEERFIDADEMLQDFVDEHNLHDIMPAAHQWVANEFYSDGPPTLAGLRLRAGLTQGQLAKLTHQPQPSISRLESGSESPSIDRARRLADALNVTLDEYYNALETTRAGRK